MQNILIVSFLVYFVATIIDVPPPIIGGWIVVVAIYVFACRLEKISENIHLTIYESKRKTEETIEKKEEK